MDFSEPMHVDQVVTHGYHRTWWLAAGLMMLLAASIGDNVFYHLQPPPTPFVLEVNGAGRPVGQVLPVKSAQDIPDAWLRGRLSDFVHDAFTVDRDEYDEDRIYNKTQSMVTGQAAQKLDAWYNRDNGKHHPKSIGPYAWIEAPVTDTEKIAPDTYLTNFRTVTHMNNNDQDTTKQEWRITLHVIVGHSPDPESLGLFVDEIDLEEVKS
jgi:type IV secretory pathway TrbF-like protein